MIGDRIRAFVHKYFLAISIIVSFVVATLFYILKLNVAFFNKKEIIATISGTMAGFLFTAQSILLTLPKDGKFYKKLEEYGYIAFINKGLKNAVFSLIFFMIVTFVIPNNNVFIFVAVTGLGYGFINAIYAIYLFEEIITKIN